MEANEIAVLSSQAGKKSRKTSGTRVQLFPWAGKTEWKTNAPYVKSYPVTQPAKVMSR